MEKSESRTRERNLKIFGIYQAGDGERTTDAEELVKTLNCFSVQRMWKLSDIESMHRIGRTRGRYLPLTVQFQSVDHKLSIHRDQDLRRNGIKVSTDLTPRQRDEIHNHKQAGRVAYYRSGRLHVQDKPAGSKNYLENRRQSLRSSAEKQVSAPSVEDHHRVSHRRSFTRQQRNLPTYSNSQLRQPYSKCRHHPDDGPRPARHQGDGRQWYEQHSSHQEHCEVGHQPPDYVAGYGDWPQGTDGSPRWRNRDHSDGYWITEINYNHPYTDEHLGSITTSSSPMWRGAWHSYAPEYPCLAWWTNQKADSSSISSAYSRPPQEQNLIVINTSAPPEVPGVGFYPHNSIMTEPFSQPPSFVPPFSHALPALHVNNLQTAPLSSELHSTDNPINQALNPDLTTFHHHSPYRKHS